MRRRGSSLNNTQRRALAVALLLFILVGGTIGVIRANVTAKQQLQVCTSTTTGTITRVRRRSRSSNRTYISYTVRGVTYSMTEYSSIGDMTGQTKTIHYDPNNPSNAYTGDVPQGKRQVPMALASMGLLSFMLITTIFKTGRR